MQFDAQKELDKVQGANWVVGMNSLGDKPPARMGHSMLYYEKTIILYGGVTNNYFFEDDKFYQFKISTKKWTILNITGSRPGFRSFHSMSFFKPNIIFIFGGQSSQYKDSEYKINNEYFLVNLAEKNSSSDFIAGLYPSSRYGHKSASNIINENNNNLKYELLLIGGLDSIYCQMDAYLLKEEILDNNYNWIYEQKKQVNDQLEDEKDHVFETAKKTILIYKKQLEVLELRNLEINQK